jgi:hypothetical protein
LWIEHLVYFSFVHGQFTHPVKCPEIEMILAELETVGILEKTGVLVTLILNT